MVKYIPKTQVANRCIDGLGCVDVGDKFIYIPNDLMMQLTKTIAQSTDLQAEITKCHDYLWLQYGKGDKLPPFDPMSLRMATIAAGAHTLCKFILNGMASEDTSEQRKAQNEKKVVTMIYMLMFWPISKGKLVSEGNVQYGSWERN